MLGNDLEYLKPVVSYY